MPVKYFRYPDGRVGEANSAQEISFELTEQQIKNGAIQRTEISEDEFFKVLNEEALEAQAASEAAAERANSEQFKLLVESGFTEDQSSALMKGYKPKESRRG